MNERNWERFKLPADCLDDRNGILPDPISKFFVFRRERMKSPFSPESTGGVFVPTWSRLIDLIHCFPFVLNLNQTRPEFLRDLISTSNRACLLCKLNRFASRFNIVTNPRTD